jgi:hypothetical protein
MVQTICVLHPGVAATNDVVGITSTSFIADLQLPASNNLSLQC